jgi:hypothetical protein
MDPQAHNVDEEGDENESEEEDFPLSYQDVQCVDWDTYYQNCPIFFHIWLNCHDPNAEWPKGIRLAENRMYHDGKLCLPQKLTQPYIRDQHAVVGHVGADRLWYHLEISTKFAFPEMAKKYAQNVMNQCETCQAAKRAHRLAGPQEPTPVPPRAMVHVALDLFHMNTVQHGAETFDTMAVCVDRHSGWIISVPCLNKGLTGRKLALIMLREWSIFGIPSIITSDRGSHFVSAWWKNMCAELGIRHAYAHSYHHASNGRAEVAGQQLKEFLRKILMEENLTWVEALPQACLKLNSAKGQAGISPYEILFGRPRPLANQPYEPPESCEDAHEFFARMKSQDEKIQRILTNLHNAQAERASQGTGTWELFSPGDKIWYRRPENSGGPVDSRWLGPCKIISREGERSYTITVKPGKNMSCERSFLKKYVEDVYNTDKVPMYFHRRTVIDDEAHDDEAEVDKILKHKVDAQGKEWYLTQWKGGSPEDASWYPQHFFFIGKQVTLWIIACRRWWTQQC